MKKVYNVKNFDLSWSKSLCVEKYNFPKCKIYDNDFQFVLDKIDDSSYKIIVKHKELYNKLWFWRDFEARQMDRVPAYVLSIVNLVEIVKVMPLSIDELCNIVFYVKFW